MRLYTSFCAVVQGVRGALFIIWHFFTIRHDLWRFALLDRSKTDLPTYWFQMWNWVNYYSRVVLPQFSHVFPWFCLPVQAQGQVVGCLATNGHHHPTRRLQLRDVHDTLVTQFFKVQAVRLVEVRGHRFLNMAQPWHRPGTHLNFPTERLVIRKASIALSPSQKDARMKTGWKGKHMKICVCVHIYI